MSELGAVADQVSAWLAEVDDDGQTAISPGSIGILVRYKKQLDQVVNGLDERGAVVRAVDSGSGSPNYPQVMTMHRAKGMEFSRVILFGVNDASLPSKLATEGLAASELADALLRERSLLYVAATRARDELVVTWSGKPSGLLAGNL